MTSLALVGPQTRMRLVRTGFGFLMLLVCGIALSQFSAVPGWRAFGLGLIMPGAGFLAYAGEFTIMAGVHAGLAIGVAGVFGLALVMWFGSGNVLAPVVVWLVSAVAAGLMPHAGIAAPLSVPFVLPPAVIAGVMLLGFLWLPWRQRLAAKQRRADAIYVAAQTPAYRGRPARPDELSPSDLKQLRFALDRALQPVDQFDGFQWIEQFQTSAVRYQLSFAGYALAMAQSRLPAFAGYLHQAQVNLIEKQRDHRVWRYWQLENMWGHLSSDADPVVRDNIMYSGFVAAQMAYFQSVTGDMQYAEPGAFSLSKPSPVLSASEPFEHDFRSLVEAQHRGWRAAPYGMMPCEPNWVYPLCNGIGATGVIAADQQLGTNAWPGIAHRLRQGMETELMGPDGRLLQFRSTLTGLAPPQFGGALSAASPSLFFNAVFPDEARRLWLLARRDMLKRDGQLNIRKFWPIDTGDYRFTRATSYAGVAAAAMEMGDGEVAEKALIQLQAECPATLGDGVLHRDRASVFSHFLELMAVFGGADQLAGIVHQPHGGTKGPMINAQAYPDVLVAKADWEQSGLSCVLYPGTGPGHSPCDRPRSIELPLSGFKPGAGFAHDGVASGEGVADEHGEAVITLELDGRSELIVRT